MSHLPSHSGLLRCVVWYEGPGLDQNIWNVFLSDWIVCFPNCSNMQEPSHVLHMNIFVVSKMVKLEADRVV